MNNQITFPTRRKAQNFVRGYCVPRVVVKQGRSFRICSPATATRLGLKVLG